MGLSDRPCVRRQGRPWELEALREVRFVGGVAVVGCEDLHYPR